MNYVKRVENMLVAAEAALRSLSNIEDQNLEEIREHLDGLLQTYETIEPEIKAVNDVFTQWNAGETTIFQQSEIDRSLGQIKRLSLVKKNILRVVKRTLGIPDPEGEQEMIQHQLANMGVIHGKP